MNPTFSNFSLTADIPQPIDMEGFNNISFACNVPASSISSNSDMRESMVLEVNKVYNFYNINSRTLYVVNGIGAADCLNVARW